MWLDDLNELVDTLKQRIEQHKDVLGKNETATRCLALSRRDGEEYLHVVRDSDFGCRVAGRYSLESLY